VLPETLSPAFAEGLYRSKTLDRLAALGVEAGEGSFAYVFALAALESEAEDAVALLLYDGAGEALPPNELLPAIFGDEAELAALNDLDAALGIGEEVGDEEAELEARSSPHFKRSLTRFEPFRRVKEGVLDAVFAGDDDVRLSE